MMDGCGGCSGALGAYTPRQKTLMVMGGFMAAGAVAGALFQASPGDRVMNSALGAVVGSFLSLAPIAWYSHKGDI